MKNVEYSYFQTLCTHVHMCINIYIGTYIYELKNGEMTANVKCEGQEANVKCEGQEAEKGEITTS